MMMVMSLGPLRIYIKGLLGLIQESMDDYVDDFYITAIGLDIGFHMSLRDSFVCDNDVYRNHIETQ